VTQPISGQGIFEAERKPWIAVCGFAPSRKHFPFGDDRWWTWGCNDLAVYEARVDVTFEIHHTMNMGVRRSPEWEQILRSGGKRGRDFAPGNPATPIFMQEAHPDYPTVIAFPKNRIIEEFGKRVLPPLEYIPSVANAADYFTNSIGWMIALAILELTEVKKVNGRDQRVAKPDARLAVVGVSMAADSEYIAQKPNVEFWIGRAMGYGIDVWVPDDAHILKAATLYGYASSAPLAIRLQSDKDDLRKKTVELVQQEQQLAAQLEQVRYQLVAVRASKDYINGLERNLVIPTEIATGSTASGPQVGREILVADGQPVQTVVVPSDNQPAHAGVS
jgi:hypothetical protein